jgi:glycosyltransferase involved in cell wall biosynthesis
MRVVAGADAFVSPTVYPEGFNRGLIEAGALERPIVATFKGATELLNDGVTALVVPPADPEAIANALERLREDPALGRRLATAMARTVRAEHRWSSIFDRFLARAGARDPASRSC